MPNVLIINTWYSYGGAATIARTIHQELNKTLGFNSHFFSMELIEEENHHCIFNGSLAYKLSRCINRVDQFFSTQYWREPFSKKILNSKAYHEADIIHCHNTHCGFFNPSLLNAFTKDGKKIILTLHDEWWLTGHCAITDNCNNFDQGCKKCPDLKRYPGIFFDNTSKLLSKKLLLLKKNKPTITSPSYWLMEKTISRLENQVACEIIPNFYNQNYFNHKVTNHSFPDFQVDSQKKILLFSANNILESNKGFLDLLKALTINIKKSCNNWHLIIAGNTDKRKLQNLIPKGISYNYLGYIKSKEEMSSLYHLADCLVMPSQCENFPLVALEAAACNTPIVAYPSNGANELISNKLGIILEKHCANLLAETLLSPSLFSTFENHDDYLQAFSFKSVFKKYCDLYNRLCANKN